MRSSLSVLMIAAMLKSPASAGGITVELSGMSIECRYLPTEEGVPIPVRWSKSRFPWISDVASCEELWRTRAVVAHPEWKGMRMAESFEFKHVVYVRTCKEWTEAPSGLGPMTNLECTVDLPPFDIQDGALSAIARSRPAVRSAWRDLDLSSIAKQLLPAPMEREGLLRRQSKELRWSISGNRIQRTDDALVGWIEPIVFADVDGDGWEDMVAGYGEKSMMGSRGESGIRAFTRKEDGRIVEITGRNPTEMPSESEWQTATQRMITNFGLPTQKEIRLQGTCTCWGGELDEPPHRYELVLQVAHGLLCGEAFCARVGKWVALTGSLTERRGLLDEFAIDESPTANLSFDWRVENGVMSIEGWKSPSAEESNECDRFAVQGAVAPVAGPKKQ